MIKRNEQAGFTTVELLITLFVAAAFLVSGYQLYALIIKDGGQTRADARASNVAYDYMRRYAASATSPCTNTTPLNNSSINVSSLSSVAVTVTISCPYSAITSVSKIDVTVVYNSPQQTIKYSTYTSDASISSSTPTTPSGVIATGSSISQVNVAWTAPSGYTPTSYTLEYATNSSFTSSTLISGISGTSQAVTGLSASITYYFHIKAIGGQGVSGYSNYGTGATYNNWSVYSLIAGVGDWNNDGNNDLVGYKPDGTLDLHLGNGNATFGPAIYLSNIGTSVRNLLGPGKLPSGTAPIVWWANSNSGPGYFLKSDGATGINGSATTSGNNWLSYTSAFTAPKFYTNGTVNIIGKLSALYIYSLDTAGAATYIATYGSGWDAAYPGDRVFGLGDFNGDGIGDIAGIDSSGNMTFYPGTGTGTTGSTASIGSGWNNDRVIGGWDYNNDGKADILRYNIGSGILGFYGGNGAAWFVTNPATNTPIN